MFFYYNMHHIISDGWSTNVLSKDVFAFYESYSKGEFLKLLPLRIQYKDYASWLSLLLNSPSYQSQRDYWINQLEGELPVFNLFSNKPRPLVKKNRGRAIGTSFSKELTEKLLFFSKEQGGTLFISLIASLKVLFYRYTGQEDIVIGTSVAGRNHLDLEEQIGFFVNSLVLRNKIKGEDDFIEMYKKVKKNVLNALKNQQYPFDKLVQDLNLYNDGSFNPIFDVMIVLQNMKSDSKVAFKESEYLNQIIDYGEVMSKFDLSIIFKEEGDVLSLYIEYNTDIYEKEYITQFIKHYKKLLLNLLGKPTKKISDQEFLLKKEREELIKGLSSKRLDYKKEMNLVSLFQEQVNKTPEDIAIIVKGRTYTYLELDELSNQFARTLKDKYRVKFNEHIGVSLSKNEWVVISILGILKVGGVYVPIDINHPSSRKEFMLKDSYVKVLIIEPFSKLDVEYKGVYLELDVDFKLGEYSSLPIQVKVSSSDIAYIIYTSGSTGIPKGVLIDHMGICNTVLDHISSLGITKEDRVLQLLSFSFDASILDVFMTLLSGAGLSIPSQNIIGDANQILSFIKKAEVSIVTMPPSYLRFLNYDSLLGVRLIVSTGEAVDIELAEYYSKSKVFFNGYGPTEVSVSTTLYEVKSGKNYNEGIPIGKPNTNKYILVLDKHNNLSPIGAVGEIYIGGSSLAKEYLNQPELTKEKFIKNPFDKRERLYKSGDLGYWLPDGNLGFIGRVDDQIKIRGYRVELNGIENVLLKHPQIKEVVVLVVEEKIRGKEIVCYFVSEKPLSSSSLRDYLREHLPDYMLPSFYVQIDEIPLTINGKVNKKELLSPEEYGISSGIEYVAPRNKIEMKLIDIWKKILGKNNIGVKDTFF